MARPVNKDELVNLSELYFSELFQLIESIPEPMRYETFPFEDRDKNIRDILMHLHEWHLMMAKWYEIGMNGDMPVTPAPGYTWKELPLLNQVIWERAQTIDYDTAVYKVRESHETMMDLIKHHSNEELFTKKKYKWTKTTHMASYFISNTSSHYLWATKKVKKFKRGLSSKDRK